VVTFVVTASGLTLLGVGAAFWGLVAGGLMMLLHRRRKVSRPVSEGRAVSEPVVSEGRAVSEPVVSGEQAASERVASEG
jgi:benzoate membrane transport protein